MEKELDLLRKLMKAAQNDKKNLRKLKNIFVQMRQFEVASKLREIENKHFPEKPEEKKAREDAESFNLLFRMVGLNITNSTSWLIAETMKLYLKKKSKFDLMDASKLKAKMHEIFDLEEE